MTEIQHKLGDSISWTLTIKDDVTGTPVNLTGTTVTSQFRCLDGTLVVTPVITLLDQGTNTGQFTLVVLDGEIFRDAPRPVFCDIQFEDASNIVTSSETFKLKLLTDVTV